MNSFVNVRLFREAFVALSMITGPPGIAEVSRGRRSAGRAAAWADRAAAAGRVREGIGAVVVLLGLAMRFLRRH